jgi:DNA modification methylase
MSNKKTTEHQQQIVMKKTCELIPYARNSRTHDERQVAQIAGSIREFGFTNPILIDAENGIIAGHGRVMAAQKLGLEEVPCIALAHLSETQKRAYIIADNKLALNSGWDEVMLGIELAELRTEDFDLGVIGFDGDEIEDIFAESAETKADPEDTPDKPIDPVSAIGDVWLLGRHRIICGDCTDALVIDKAMSGAEWDGLIFDPPYELEELYTTAMLPSGKGKKLIIFWDFKRFATAAKSAVEFGWNPLYELIWDNVTSWYTPNRPLARHKACGIFGDDPKWDFEKAIIRDGKKREAKTVRNTRGESEYVPLDGAVHLRTIEAFPTTAEKGGHAHSKPVEWIAAILNGTGSSTILDLFSGSGTTIIAGEMTMRAVHAIELNPAYVDVAAKRWQDFTGKQAIHEASGKTFDEMKIEKQ